MFYRRSKYPDSWFCDNFIIRLVGNVFRVWNSLKHCEEHISFENLDDLKQWIQEKRYGHERNIGQ